MAFSDLYIDSTTQAGGVSSLPDVPTMSAADLKAAFDFLALTVIDSFNGLLEQLSSADICSSLYAYDADGHEMTLQDVLALLFAENLMLRSEGAAAMIPTRYADISVQTMLDKFNQLFTSGGAGLVLSIAPDGDIVSVQHALDSLRDAINSAQLGALTLSSGVVTADMISDDYVPDRALHAASSGDKRIFRVVGFPPGAMSLLSLHNNICFSQIAVVGDGSFFTDTLFRGAMSTQGPSKQYPYGFSCAAGTLLHIVFDLNLKISCSDDAISKLNMQLWAFDTCISVFCVSPDESFHLHADSYVTIPDTREEEDRYISLDWIDASKYIDFSVRLSASLGTGWMTVEEVK